MECPQCRRECGQNDRFCSECAYNLRSAKKPGTRMECPQCRRECGQNDRFCSECACSLHSVRTPVPEMQHFGLVEDCKLQDWSVIGAGGFGQIYKAKHKDLGMEVAIKLLHYDDGSSASLQKEAEFMQQGGGPYVVRVFGVYRGVPPGRERSSQMGLVMELMERGSVESLLKRLRGPPPWPLAFRLAHQVALGMNFLHKLSPPLLHLDLKPSNVLLDHGFGAKITDFGLARLMRSISAQRGEDGGTLSYMPPEAFRTPYKATPTSDSYSYAILLWSIITGREPYGDAALGRIRLWVQDGDRPSLEGVNRAAVEGLGENIDLMERCWDPSPQKRPSFHDCLPVTEKVFKLHSHGIHDAIHQVSKALDEKREISPIPKAGVTVHPRGGWNSKDWTPPNFRAADSGIGTEPCPASATSKALSDSISKTSSTMVRALREGVQRGAQMEETESRESEAVEEKQQTDLGEVLQKAGLDWRYWTKVFKEERGVECSVQLQYLNVTDYQILKKHVHHEWESRALQKMLGVEENHLQPEQNPASQNEENQVEQTEKQRQEKQRIPCIKNNLEELKTEKDLLKVTSASEFSDLEISAYSKLEKSYGQWSWSIRKQALEKRQTWSNKINSKQVDEVYMSDLIKEFDEIYGQLKDEIETYFTCEEHPEILVNWKGDVDRRFETLKDQLIEDTQRKCRDLLNIRKCGSELEGMKFGYEGELLRMSRSLASKLKDEKLTSDQMIPHFDELWTKWLTKISSEKGPENQVDIQAVVEDILNNQFKKEKDIAQKILNRKAMVSFQFQVDKHVSVKRLNRFLKIINVSDTANIEKDGQRLTEEITTNVQMYIDRKSRENVDFSAMFVHEILESISQTLDTYEKKESHIKLLEEYKVDISIYMCTKAVTTFNKMHTDFKRKNDLLTCLSEKKKQYFKYFKDCCDGATSVKILANFLGNHLGSAIKQAMYSKVSLQIVDKMKSNYPAFSGNRANLEDHILKELAERENFDLYVEYLERPKEHFEKFIRRRVEEYCGDHSLTSELLNRNLNILVDKTLTESSIVTSELKEKDGTISMWLDKFCSKLGGVFPISRDSSRNVECEGTSDLSFLQDMMAQSLSDMQEKAKEEIKTSSLDFDMFEILCWRPDDILIDQLSGCWEQCPFCKAICTNTMADHDTDHSVRFHRSKALAGWRYRHTTQFSVEFCTTLVSSNLSFSNAEGKFTPHKEYRKAGPPYDKWSIKPDSCEKKYWKWFVCVFRNKLQEKFALKFEGKGKIPDDWEKISQDKAAVVKELGV